MEEDSSRHHPPIQGCAWVNGADLGSFHPSFDALLRAAQAERAKVVAALQMTPEAFVDAQQKRTKFAHILLLFETSAQEGATDVWVRPIVQGWKPSFQEEGSPLLGLPLISPSDERQKLTKLWVKEAKLSSMGAHARAHACRTMLKYEEAYLPRNALLETAGVKPSWLARCVVQSVRSLGPMGGSELDNAGVSTIADTLQITPNARVEERAALKGWPF